MLLLAAWFLHEFSRKYNKPGLTLDETAEEALKLWSWPGNVRELQHSMERAVILAEHKNITRDSFQFSMASIPSTASLDGSLEEVEARLIHYAIKKNGGNISAVAAQLGISRQTLYNKMKKYGI